MEVQDVVRAIVSGELDGKQDVIRQAFSDRRDALNTITKATMAVGDPIQVKGCRPKYLNGKSGVIVKINLKKVVIDLDEPCGSFHRGVHCPVSMLELV